MAKSFSKTSSAPLATNRKAYFHYAVQESLECGIELKGTEVKSVKLGHFSFSDAFAEVKDGELFLLKLQISPYKFGNLFNHNTQRKRRLLAHKMEIRRLHQKVKEKGCTLIPLKFYLKSGRLKVELGLCKGKKLYDKRESIKAKDLERTAQRERKERGSRL